MKVFRFYRHQFGVIPFLLFSLVVTCCQTSSNQNTNPLPTQPEASALIDQAGGTLEVTNPSSPLWGTKVVIPPGAVNGPQTFKISKNTTSITQLPNGFEQCGPMMLLSCSSNLLNPVIVELPVRGDRLENELRLFLHYDATYQKWEMVDPLPGRDGTTMRYLVHSFSLFALATTYVNATKIHSSFDMCTDSLVLTYNPSICAGISLIAEQYFRFFADKNKIGLKCWWNEDTSRIAATQAQEVFHGRVTGWYDDWVRLWNLIGRGFEENDATTLVDALITSLQNNEPKSIVMFGKDPVGHSVLVIGWEETGPRTGKFLVYENQDHSIRELSYSVLMRITPPFPIEMNYQDANGYTYSSFARSSTHFTGYPLISDIIESHAPNAYGQCVDCGVSNSSFEKGNVDGELPFGWTGCIKWYREPPPVEPQEHYWSNSISHTGNHAIGFRISSGGGLYHDSYWEPKRYINIRPNLSSSVHLWIKWSEPAVGQKLNIHITEYDKYGNSFNVCGHDFGQVGAYDTLEWQEVIVNWPASPDAYYIQISLGLLGFNTGGDYPNAILWIDDVEVIQN